jgi:hypothetical protein
VKIFNLTLSNISVSTLSVSTLTVLLLAVSMHAGSESCLPDPEKELEAIYCTLRKQGRLEGYPPLYQFRNNTPLMQAHILKKPAARAGITVNIPVRSNRDTVSRQQRILSGSTSNAPPATSNPKESSNGNSGCRADGIKLVCGTTVYRLLGNLPNSKLNTGSLEPGHKLNLPLPPTGGSNSPGFRDWLFGAYHRYIEGMREIGLAGSTMSLEKFTGLYLYLETTDADFNKRFETMYGFLKKDKLELGVDTRVRLDKDFSSDQCYKTGHDTLTCQHGSKNHVFILQ